MMDPHYPRIQKFLPYTLPVTLALVVTVFVFWGGRSQNSSSTLDTVESHGINADSRKVDAVFASSGQTSTDPIGVPAAGILRELAPADQRVADLIQNYQAGDHSVKVLSMEALATKKQGDHVVFSVANMELSGVVQSKQEQQGCVSLAVRLDEELGRFTLRLHPDQRAYATLFFEGEHHAFSFRGLPQHGQWQMAHKSVETVMCAPAGSRYSSRAQIAGMPRAKAVATEKTKSGAPLGAPPELESDPTSSFVIYIDLDGELVEQPEWSDQPIDAEPHPRADEVDFVTRVWKRVSEDFAPFNINVTTSRTVFDAAPAGNRVMCVATPNDTAMPGAGGVAFLGSFGSGLVCWAFNDSEGTLADTVSHEVGHTLGLGHDGKVNVYEYYGGHGSGEVSWAPIMGAYFADFDPPFVDEELTQWGKGEYPDATNQEDDLAIITSQNGFGYRQDDYSNTMSDADNLPAEEGVVTLSGVVERTNDEDWFRFPTNGGDVKISAKSADVDSPEHGPRGSNLALAIELYDEEGTLITRSAPDDALDAEISLSLESGNYFLKVEGAGRGDLVTGFSDYGSLGQYSISGTIPQDGIIAVVPETNTAPYFEADYSVQVRSKQSWSWSANADWVVCKESKTQTGDQAFSYALKLNRSSENREAEITFISGDFSAVHRIIQRGSFFYDDHGDTNDDATLILQDSLTECKLELEGDRDVFRIEVVGFGTFRAKALGSTATRLTLSDLQGKVLTTSEDSGSENMRIAYAVMPGTYFVKVRHELPAGVGSYDLQCSFTTGEGLFVDRASQTAGQGSGHFLLQVYSSSQWSWKTDASWISSSSAPQQSFGKSFDYTIQANTTRKSRTGEIIFQSGRQRVVHRVIQMAQADDDHSNTRKLATVLNPNGSQKGRIGYEGDTDIFRLDLAASGTLDLSTTGNTDTVGELIDASGTVLASSDSGDRSNFRLVSKVNAGSYYLRISGFNATLLGDYVVQSSFTADSLIDLKYSAGKGGLVKGPRVQTVVAGQDGRSVKAVPSYGYAFHRWSDGSRESVRQDSNVVSHKNVTAEFKASLQFSESGTYAPGDQPTMFAFGKVEVDSQRSKTIRVHNLGKATISNLKVVNLSAGSRWKASRSGLGALAPGQSTTFKITYHPSSQGAHQADFRIRAPGLEATLPFQVKGSAVASEESRLSAKREQIAKAVEEKGRHGLEADRLPWIHISQDGFFRYRFTRPAGDATEQMFWISPDGLAWEEALVLDVWKTQEGREVFHYEAVFAPPAVPAPSVLVNESDPQVHDTHE